MAVSSGLRDQAVSDPRERVDFIRGAPFWMAVRLAADWLCAAAASLAVFPAGELWPSLLLVSAAWIGTTGTYRLYERRFLGPGSEEFRRVVRAAFAATAVASAVCAVLIRSDRDLRSVLLVIPVTGALSIAARRLVRGVAVRLNDPGARRALLIGTPSQTAELAALLSRNRGGTTVVGALVAAPPNGYLGAIGMGLPVLGVLREAIDPDEMAASVAAADCDTVIVLPGPYLDATVLRRFSWQLGGLGVDLFVAPLPVEISSGRLALQLCGGVPLFHVRAPEVSRLARLPKEIAERIAAVLGMILLAPLFAVVAVAIVRGDGGPVFFRQVRIGLRGEPFTLYKFRSMSVDAEDGKATLAHLNVNGDGPLFKMRLDPRVTKTGAVLRRFSLDELPQLLNVASGAMSLIGPRPPLPAEAAAYCDETRRRLLVKPGLTGLWQVSGRSDLSWEEAMRLDIGYVENWSLALDASILLRTGSAVLKGTGAY